MQWHLSIDGSGRIDWHQASDEAHVAPGNSCAPVTWFRQSDRLKRLPQLIRLLEDELTGPYPALLLQRFAVEKGYSLQEFKVAITFVKAHLELLDATMTYLPGPELLLLQEFRQKHGEASASASDARPTQPPPSHKVAEGGVPWSAGTPADQATPWHQAKHSVTQPPLPIQSTRPPQPPSSHKQEEGPHHQAVDAKLRDLYERLEAEIGDEQIFKETIMSKRPTPARARYETLLQEVYDSFTADERQAFKQILLA